MASTAAMSMDVAPGTPPSNLYLTGVNQQVLPPGTGLAVVRPPPPSAPTSQTVQQPGMTAYPAENAQLPQQEIVNDGSYEKRQCVAVSACCICFFLVIVLPVLIGAVSNSNHATQYSPSPYIPSYYPPSTPTWDLPYDDDDYFSPNSPIYNFAPTAPPNPTTSPAPSGQHTMPPWLLPYFPPTTPPAPTTSPAPTIKFAPFTVYTFPPHFFSPTYYDPPSPSKGAMVPLPNPNHVSNVMDYPDRTPKTDDSQFDLSKSDKVNADSGATPDNNELDVDGGAPTPILS